MQTLKEHKHGINQGLTPEAKLLLDPVLESAPVSAIINSEGQQVDYLHLITCADGRTFVEVVDQRIGHRDGITVYFLSLTDRFGVPVLGSLWTKEEVRKALVQLEDSGVVNLSVRLHRGKSPPTSYSRH
jgi:hypothetical protein